MTAGAPAAIRLTPERIRNAGTRSDVIAFGSANPFAIGNLRALTEGKQLQIERQKA